VDGKEKILPVLEQNEIIQQQMQQMAQENAALQHQVASLNETLDGYANLVSSPAGTDDALVAMGGTGQPIPQT
jgi:prefoldin subunit 5